MLLDPELHYLDNAATTMVDRRLRVPSMKHY